jgi:hypothetical protein
MFLLSRWSIDACGVITLDGRGGLYIIGYTSSTDFPTVNALQPGLYPGNCGTPPAACRDGFIASLSADGQDIIFSTYLGGSGDDLFFGNYSGHSFTPSGVSTQRHKGAHSRNRFCAPLCLCVFVSLC